MVSLKKYCIKIKKTRRLKIQWFKFAIMFCQFACSPHPWCFVLFCCALMSGRILGQVEQPYNLEQPNQDRQHQTPKIHYINRDETLGTGTQNDSMKPFFVENVNNSEQNTNVAKPAISDKVTTSTNVSIAAVANNGSAVEKPAWDGTSSATVSQQDMDSGALFRLFLVLSALCAFSIVYVGYRFYRTRKGDSKPLAVRKYGVLTQRTDIEMLPLPLDDDDDDDTVFDVGNHTGGR